MVVDRIRQWAILFRAHTAMLEVPIAVMGAALGLGHFWSVEVGLWAIFGAIYHYSGYGMNSYVDWKKGYDKNDSAKSNHPLNTGKISPESAKIAVGLMFILAVTYPLYLTRGDILAFSLVILAVLCGITYNFFGKVTDYKFIPISIAHSLIFLIPYALYNGSIDLLGIVMFSALFVHHTFQISISGDVKDILQDESSLLKSLGYRYEEKEWHSVVHNSALSDFYCFLVVILQIYIIDVGFIAVYGIDSPLTTLLLAVMNVTLAYGSIGVYQSGIYVRSQRVSIMSRREIIGYWSIYMLSIPIIGLQNYATAFTLSIVYLIILSRFMWGTHIRPEV